MTGPIRQILVDGKPTAGRLDDTHVWCAGGLLTGDASPAKEDTVNTIDPTDSRSLDQAVMMGMPGLENPCVERIANTPDGVQPCYGCTLDCPYCNPAKEDTMNLYQHNHAEDDGTVSTHYYSVPEDDCSPVRPEDEERDAESGYVR